MSAQSSSPSSMPLAAELQHALGSRGQTIAVAESLTGGLLGAALTDLPGSSATFRGGVVAYATELKASLLDVDAALLRREGAVHPEVAVAMARGARFRLRATFGLATTGVAGPEPQDGREPGEVHVALAGPGVGHDDTRVLSLHLDGGRADVRREAVLRALALAVEELAGDGKTQR